MELASVPLSDRRPSVFVSYSPKNPLPERDIRATHSLVVGNRWLDRPGWRSVRRGSRAIGEFLSAAANEFDGGRH